MDLDIAEHIDLAARHKSVVEADHMLVGMVARHTLVGEESPEAVVLMSVSSRPLMCHFR